MRRLMKHLRSLGWNQRPFTEDDFYEFCYQEGVVVFRETRGWPGEYFQRRGRAIILLHPALKGHTLLWVAFHELAHFWLHTPGSEFAYGLERKIDLQADRIAVPAIIPKAWLEEPGIFGLAEQGYPPSLLERRVEIFKKCRV